MISYEVNLLCDTERCPEFITSEPDDQADAHALLAQALNLNWVIRDGKHLCPKCAVNLNPK